MLAPLEKRAVLERVPACSGEKTTAHTNLI